MERRERDGWRGTKFCSKRKSEFVPRTGMKQHYFYVEMDELEEEEENKKIPRALLYPYVEEKVISTNSEFSSCYFFFLLRLGLVLLLLLCAKFCAVAN